MAIDGDNISVTDPQNNTQKFVGPDARSPVTLLLIMVPATVFCVFVAWLVQNEFSSILVMTILFTIWVLVLLFITSPRGPGIIPPEGESDAGGRQTASIQEDIKVYVAPDFSCPSQVSRDFIVETLFGGKPSSTTTTPKKRKGSLLFNSTRGFRDVLIPQEEENWQGSTQG